jgi:hypothetical protein
MTRVIKLADLIEKLPSSEQSRAEDRFLRQLVRPAEKMAISGNCLARKVSYDDVWELSCFLYMPKYKKRICLCFKCWGWKCFLSSTGEEF